ncbi:hypothetical protein JQX13_25625 [Archangium violaceum]|uniref:hypothetical protein n=1 Tax=Archangium violaceum TaxID=83451 RepID=UPI00193BC64D|nr:hypothetical protein [Archangium violaceum]QRK13106.1 hypothetical protein JQX13_25625 [Archangium violaceum]
MHPLPLVVFLTLAAGPDRTIPVGCREDYETCREDCTIDYGGSTTKYRQLSQCLEGCANEQSECTTRHYTLRDANIDPLPAREADPAMRETRTYDDDLRDSDTAKPASDTGTSDGMRRGVYRASEEEPPARTEPAVMKEPEPESEPESEPEEEEPQPAPAPKPSEPLRPTPPPEPKKKDISEWDPNGD